MTWRAAVLPFPAAMPKAKPSKGLLKRVRITGSGRIKMHRAYGRHLRSHKSASMIRGYRKPKFIEGEDAARLRVILGLPLPKALRNRRKPAPARAAR